MYMYICIYMYTYICGLVYARDLDCLLRTVQCGGLRKRMAEPPKTPHPPPPLPPPHCPQESTNSPLPGNDGVPDPIPPQLRKAICVYEAGKVRARGGGWGGWGCI